MSDYLKEEWRPLTVEGCEYRYEISNYGRVMDKLNNTLVSQVLTGKPAYFYVNLHPTNSDGVKGKRLLRRVHNLVGQVFLEKEDESYTIVDHIDRNKYNNSLDNLRWICRGGNSRNMNNNVKFTDGRLVKDVCDKEGLPFHKFTYIFYGDNKDISVEDAYKIACSEYWITFQGKKYIRSDVENLINIDSKVLKHFLDKGLSYEDIYESKFKCYLEEKEYCYSVEVFGKWFPTKQRACEYYNIPVSTVQARMNEGETLEEALTPRERKDTRRVLEYKGEDHTFESLSSLSGLPIELIQDRISTKGWSVEKAVETPLQKIKFYYLNGERMTKKAMLERLGISNTKSFNSYQSKTNLPIETILTDRYGIDLTDIKISTTA